MNYEKIYIGKAKKHETLDILKAAISIDALETLKEQAYKNLIFFEIAKLREPDQFGNTHTCYYSKQAEKPVLIPIPEAQSEIPNEDDLPF